MKNEEFESQYRKLVKSVEKRRNRKVISRILFCLFLILASWFCFVILYIGLDSLIYLTRPWRILLRIFFYLIPLFVIFSFLKDVGRIWRLRAFTDFIETNFPKLKGRLFAALECSPRDPLFSSSLINANLEDAKNIFDSLPRFSVITNKHRLVLRVLYSLFIFTLLIFAIFSHSAVPSAARFLFEKNIAVVSFFVSPGNSYVEKGNGLSILLNKVEGRVYKPRVVTGNGVVFLKKETGSCYKAEIESIQKSFSYHIEFSDTTSLEYHIDVVELPGIRNIQFRLLYPAYSKEKAHTTSDFELYALKGTEIEVSGISNDSLKKASLVFDDSTFSLLKVDGRKFKGNFNIYSSKAFTLNLVSSRGLKNADKPLFHIFTLEDEFPSIEILYPGEDINLPQELMLKLVLDVRDDYGISRVQLVWQKDREKHTEEIGRNFKDSELTLEFSWNLMSLSIFPGDTIKYYVRAYDNDVISGPKMTKSKIYEIRFPTATEIYREIASEGERAQESFETQSDQMERAKQGLLELEKSLKETKKLSWEEKEKAREILKREKELIESVEKTRKEMENIAEKINNAFLSNPDIKERLLEIERLMKEIETEEIKKSIEELKKSLANLDRKAMLKSMEKMLASQEEIKKTLERTIEMLKRIAQEEKYKRIVDAAKELESKQIEINKKMEEKSASKLGNMKAMEEKIQEELSGLEKEMGELAKELGKSDSTAKNALENAEEMAKEVSKGLQKTEQAMKQGNKSMSRSLGSKAQNSLSKMSNTLSAGLSSMMGERSEEVARMLNAIIDDVILLSERSENVMKASQERKVDTDNLLSYSAAIRSGIERTLVNIEELKSKNPFVPPIVSDELLRGISNIASVMRYIEGNNTTFLSRYAKSAMQALNNAALVLIESKENMSSSSSGSMAQLMQQLQSLSSGQMQVNQGTQSLIPLDLSSGSISGESERQLQRLSELQGSLAQRLKQVEEGIEKEGGNVLGDLGKIADEMEDIAKKLGNYNVDRQLVERQERILSRMLDAERSVHKREFSNKRVAERPGEYERREPGSLSLKKEEKEGIKKDILKELKQKYPSEYKDFIRAYFDKLLKEEKNHK